VRWKLKVITSEGDYDLLDLLGDIHLKQREDLDLPDDNPDRSYGVRSAFIRRAFRNNDDMRWSGLFGQFCGRDKLGSDFAHAANLGISVSSIAS
jgi:hypothetical protein